MLDKVRSVIMPSGLEAERNDIQTRLDTLNGERETVRLELGRLALESGNTNGPLAGGDRERNGLAARLQEIDGQIKGLRARRRELDALLRPKPEAEVTKLAVAMPPALVKLQADLDAARAERLQHLARSREADTPKEATQHLAKVRETEDRIAGLRQDRANALAPYNAQVVEAVTPIIARAAARALEGAAMTREALDELQDIATMLPTVPGGPPPLWPSTTIDRRPLIAAETFARTVIEGIER
jgi:chromosome segregation ATPase